MDVTAVSQAVKSVLNWQIWISIANKGAIQFWYYYLHNILQIKTKRKCFYFTVFITVSTVCRFLNGLKGNHLYSYLAKNGGLLIDTNNINDKDHQPLETMKGWSMFFPTGVAGRDREACTAESVLSMSRVGELGADILATSEVLSRTANSCRKSARTCTFYTDKTEQTWNKMECFVQFLNLITSATCRLPQKNIFVWQVGITKS